MKMKINSDSKPEGNWLALVWDRNVDRPVIKIIDRLTKLKKKEKKIISLKN